MKRCSTSLIIREVQIKTTIRHHLTPFRMDVTKKSRNKKCWQRCKEKEALVPIAGHVIGTVNLENSMEVPQKIKIDLSHDPAIPFLSIYQKKSKTLI